MRMRIMRLDNLGELVTDYLDIVNPKDIDIEIAEQGDCVELFWAGIVRDAEDFTDGHGLTLNEFYRLIEERTSPRWVHFHIPMFGTSDDDEGRESR